MTDETPRPDDQPTSTDPETVSPEVPETATTTDGRQTPQSERPEPRDDYGASTTSDSSTRVEGVVVGPDDVTDGADPYAPVPGLEAADQPTWQQRFIAAMRLMPNVRVCCHLAGISRVHAYRWRGQDPKFAAAWSSAIEDGCDRLEQAIFDRAVNGVERTRTTYRKDGSVASTTTEIVYNDRGAEFLLRAYRPEKFRERFEVKRTDDDSIDADIRELARELGLKAGGDPVPREGAPALPAGGA